jgi:hypothetical protein
VPRKSTKHRGCEERLRVLGRALAQRASWRSGPRRAQERCTPAGHRRAAREAENAGDRDGARHGPCALARIGRERPPSAARGAWVPENNSVENARRLIACLLASSHTSLLATSAGTRTVASVAQEPSGGVVGLVSVHRRTEARVLASEFLSG